MRPLEERVSRASARGQLPARQSDSEEVDPSESLDGNPSSLGDGPPRLELEG